MSINSYLDDRELNSKSYLKKKAEKALKVAKEGRRGKKFELVQIGPKTWVEREIKE